nr:nucleotide-binding alpha-beta plait domain-containing protein [Tanacetum cinerariifolium]
MGIFRTKEDEVSKISTSILVSNFPDSFSSKYLFHACKQYGHVVDSFIPSKRAKDDKRSSVVADKVDVVVKKSVKASSVVADKVDVVKDNVDVVADKASDALKNKLTGKGKKPVVGKDKDKPKNIAPDLVKEKFKPNPKKKVISSEI